MPYETDDFGGVMLAPSKPSRQADDFGGLLIDEPEQGNFPPDAKLEVPADYHLERPMVEATPTILSESAQAAKEGKLNLVPAVIRGAQSDPMYQSVRRSLGRLFGVSEADKIAESVPVTQPDGSTAYEYKPQANEIEKRGLLPALIAAGSAVVDAPTAINLQLQGKGSTLTDIDAERQRQMFEPNANDSSIVATAKAAHNAVLNLAHTVANPVFVKGFDSRVVSGAFAADMTHGTWEQIKQATQAPTLQGKIEGWVGAVLSALFAAGAAKHASVGHALPPAKVAAAIPEEDFHRIVTNPAVRNELPKEALDVFDAESARRNLPKTPESPESRLPTVDEIELERERLRIQSEATAKRTVAAEALRKAADEADAAGAPATAQAARAQAITIESAEPEPAPKPAEPKAEASVPAQPDNAALLKRIADLESRLSEPTPNAETPAKPPESKVEAAKQEPPASDAAPAVAADSVAGSGVAAIPGNTALEHRGRTASWVIRNKETGEVILETDQPSVVKKINTDKYEAVAIGDYLSSLNQKPSSAPVAEPLSVATQSQEPTPSAATTDVAPEPVTSGEEFTLKTQKTKDATTPKKRYKRKIPPSSSGHDAIDTLLNDIGRITHPETARRKQLETEGKTPFGKTTNLHGDYDQWMNLPPLLRKFIFKPIGEQGEAPGSAATTAHAGDPERAIAPFTKDPYSDTLREAILDAWRARLQFKKSLKNQAREMKDYAAQADAQARAWKEDSATPHEGSQELTTWDIGDGDIIEVHGETFEVSKNPDGSLTLDDGKRYGSQILDEGTAIHGAVVDQGLDPVMDEHTIDSPQKADAYINANAAAEGSSELPSTTPASVEGNGKINANRQGDAQAVAGSAEVVSELPKFRAGKSADDLLQGENDVFNLVSETAADKATRLKREQADEAAKAAKESAEAKALQEKQQTNLFDQPENLAETLKAGDAIEYLDNGKWYPTFVRGGMNKLTGSPQASVVSSPRLGTMVMTTLPAPRDVMAIGVIRRAPPKGAEAVATRIVNAEERFIEFAMENGGLTKEQAEAALESYRKNKAIKIDPVGGQFTFTDGGFAERDVLRRAAGIEDQAPTPKAKSPPKGFEKLTSAPTKEGIGKHITKFYGGEEKSLVPISGKPNHFAIVSKSGKTLNTVVVETERGFFFGKEESKTSPTKEPATPSSEATTPSKAESEKLQIDAYSIAQTIADSVVSDRDSTPHQAAFDAAYRNAASSIESTGAFNPDFMRKSAMTAASKEAEKLGTSLDAPIGDSETTGQDLLPSKEAGPVEHAQASNVQELIDGEMAKLPENQRKIMEETANGTEDAAIAENLGITKGSVVSLRSKAKKTLASKLADKLGQAIEATKREPGKLYADPFLIESVGRPALRAALQVMKAAIEAGRPIIDAIEEAILSLRASVGVKWNADIEAKAREFFAPVTEVEKPSPKTPEPPAVEPPAKPTDESGKPPSATGISQAAHETRAGSQVTPGAGVTPERMIEEGRAALESGADVEAIVQKIDRGEGISALETGIIRARVEELARASNRAGDAAESDPSPANRKAASDALREEIDFRKRIKPAGTQWHAVGQAMQGETDIDTGSFTGMRRAFNERTGKDMTADQEKKAKEHVATIAKQDAEIAELQGKLDEFINGSKPESVSEIMDRVLEDIREAKKSKGAGETLIDFGKRMETAARERLRARSGGRLFSGLDPLDLLDHAQIGASWIIQGVGNLASFTARLVKTYGEVARPHANEIYEASKKQAEILKEAHKSAKKDRTEPKPKEVAAKVSGEPTQTDIYNLVRAKLAEDPSVKLSKSKIAEIMQSVADDLQPVKPGITADEVTDLFSGYGKTHKPLSTEEINVKMRELHSASGLVSKLKRAIEGEVPQKIGTPRDKPTPLVRELTKELVRTMKENGLESADAEGMLKTAHDARVTRLRNAIEDTQRQIEQGARTPRGTQGIEWTAEESALKDQLVDMKSKLDDMLNEPDSDEVSRVMDRIEAVTDKLATGNIEAKAKNQNVPTKELSDAREKLTALNKELADRRKARRDIENPPKTEEQKTLESLLKRNQAARDKLASGDLSTKVGKPTVPTKEIIDARNELAETNRLIAEARKNSADAEQKTLDSIKRRIDETRARIANKDFTSRSSKKLGPKSSEESKAEAELKSEQRRFARARAAEAGKVPKDTDGLREYFEKKRLAGTLGDAFSPAEVVAIWNQVRAHVDTGNRNFADIANLVGADLGLRPDVVKRAITQNKATRKLTEDMYRKMYDRRQAINSAKQWVESADKPAIAKAIRSITNYPRAIAVLGHANAMITHAGQNAFRPEAWADWGRNLVANYKFLGSKAYHEAAMQQLVAHPDYNLALKSGLRVAPGMIEDYAAYGKFLGHIGEAGNRAMDSLKTFRMDYFSRELQKFDPTIRKEVAPLLAEWINHISGYSGALSKLGDLSGVPRETMFAPALEASRWANIIGDPVKYGNIGRKMLLGKEVSPAERAMFRRYVNQTAQLAAVYVGTLLANYGLQAATGQEDKVNLFDPTKTDWLKFKWAGRTYDPTGGLTGPLRLLANLLMDINPFHKNFQGQSGLTAAAHDILFFSRGKLDPKYGILADVADRQNIVGRPMPFSEKEGTDKHPKFTWGEYALEHSPIPLAEASREIFNTLKENGTDQMTAETVAKGLISFAIGAFGIKEGYSPAEPEEKSTIKLHGGSRHH